MLGNHCFWTFRKNAIFIGIHSLIMTNMFNVYNNINLNLIQSTSMSDLTDMLYKYYL